MSIFCELQHWQILIAMFLRFGQKKSGVDHLLAELGQCCQLFNKMFQSLVEKMITSATILSWGGARVRKYCGSQNMLQNKYFLAKSASIQARRSPPKLYFHIFASPEFEV